MSHWWIRARPGRRRLHGVRPRRWLPKRRCQFYVKAGGRTYLLTSLPWKGICVVGMWTTCTPLVHLEPPRYSWEFPSMKKKLGKLEDKLVKHLAALESEILRGLLPLLEHCAVRQYDDGDPREPGWFTVRTQGAAWVVQVKDPDSACSFAAVAETLDKALESAALLLSCDDAPWEPDSFLMASKAKKRK